jgi:hypothetical protein
MRRLLLPLVILLSLLALAASAQALSLAGAPSPPADQSSEEADEGEAESEAEEEESDDCVIEDEEDVQLCAEIAREERETAEAERCVLESASASVAASPTSDKVRLTVRYTTYGPAPFSLRYRLRGGKGGLSLGSAKARFGRAGVFHDVVPVDERKMPKVLAAREFQIELQAQKTPGFCRERLTVQRRGGS